MLPKAPDLGVLLVRTDYSDDLVWHAALSAATAVYKSDDYERMGALLRPVESSALSNLTPQELVSLPREDYLSLIAVADAQMMRDQTVLFVDFNELNRPVGRTFRSIPSEVEPPRREPDAREHGLRGVRRQHRSGWDLQGILTLLAEASARI